MTSPALKDPAKTRVIVGMSGGVDSSVSALLLIEQGYQVEGLFMKNWEEDDGTEYCTAREDLADAQAVCDRIGIKLHTANFAAEYWDNVFEHFLEEYKAGRTPTPTSSATAKSSSRRSSTTPCRWCRPDRHRPLCAPPRHWRAHRTAKGPGPEQGPELLPARRRRPGNRPHAVPGRRTGKAEVRAIAEKHGLATAKKKDSTGICFIGERRFSDFLKQYLPAQPGDIETTEGEVIGRHHGLMYHTIGQRQGLGIGGLKDASDEPWYVLHKDLARNVLVVGQGNEHPWLFSRALLASDIFWVNPVDLGSPRQLTAKVRYRQSDQRCTLERTASGYRAVFDEPQRAVTPGQSVVFYDGEVCLGGGVIEAAEPWSPRA